jgi:hypothetical protein
MRNWRRAGAVLSLAALAACQTASGPGPITVAGSESAFPTMDRVMRGAMSCWSGDQAFASYRLAPELNSFSGRPRILIVAKSAPESRPLAVTQAEGTPASVQAFGPLMGEALGNRIAADVKRWVAGNGACTAAA